MAVQVKTYLDPSNWSERENDYEEMICATHLCATSKMRDGIKGTYEDFDGSAIVTFAEVRDNLFEFWFSREIRFQLGIEISERLGRNSERFDAKQYQFIKKNLTELIETIMGLRFIGIHPVHLKGLILSGKEKALLTLWESCFLESDLYRWECKKLEELFTEPKSIINDLKDKLDIDIIEQPIYLQGFYFITPEQQVILKCLDRSGAELVFFNLYDDRYEESFSFVRKFINDEHGWCSDWQMESMLGYPEKGTGADFLKVFEGIRPDAGSVRETVKEYPDFNVFLQQIIMPVREDDDGSTAIVSTSADILNGMLDNYFPERRGNAAEDVKNYLKYPIGRFLMNLHDIHESGNRTLDFMTIVELFSSGFLEGTDDIPDAGGVIRDLYDLESYCKDCTTMKQWEIRLIQLKEFDSEVISQFKEDGSRIGTASANPFKRLSYANVGSKRIDAILHHLKVISNMVGYLFSDGERTTIDVHFQKIRRMIGKFMKGSKVTEDDLVVMEHLSDSLGQLTTKVSCRYEYITDALTLYLSGRDKENEDPIIIPFIEVDGLAFKGKGDIEKYYVTGLDDGGLPLGKYDMPYPLTEETVKELGEINMDVRYLLYRNDSIKQISRYLLYIVFKFLGTEDMELSWIRDFADKEDLGMSIYMSILGANKEPVPVVYKKPSYIQAEHDEESFERDIRFNLFLDFVAEYNFCERRFLYSYLLGSHSYFSEDFNQKFIYGEIAKLVKGETESDKDTLRTMKLIFPQWDDTFLQMNGYQQMEYASNTLNPTFFAGKRLDDRRFRLIFPGIRSERLEDIKTKSAQADANVKESMLSGVFRNTNTQECFYCPEQWHCPLAVWEVDDEKGE